MWLGEVEETLCCCLSFPHQHDGSSAAGAGAAQPSLCSWGHPGAGRTPQTPICKCTYMSKPSPARTWGHSHPERCVISPASAWLCFPVARLYQKNSSFPQKEHWDSGEGGDGGLENRSLHFEIKFGLETSSLILTKPSVSSISRRATRSHILEGRRGVGSAPSPWLW